MPVFCIHSIISFVINYIIKKREKAEKFRLIEGIEIMKKYIPGMILTLLLGLFGVFNADTMALDSDYKNNLLKVDVVKANDGSYKVDLFTQKPYNEPIKVIKKSDTNYYILLPETYHSITSVGAAGDISKVDVKLFPYAGQDLNNGYTKINILTNKPVTFSTNVRTAGKQAPQIDSRKLDN